mmetsp:Transcript_9216/g.13941  ORF Transcript_9216/g.13941 Transcript_9216/m.13941 type:complete len:191 (-) Transcript_9216:132-704(-)
MSATDYQASDRNIDLGEVYHTVDDFIDHEVEVVKKRSRAFRRAWVPVIKSILASTADIVGDWAFYIRTKNAYGLDEYETPLYFFCLVASGFGFLAIMGQLLKSCSCMSKNESKFNKKCLPRIKWLLGCEMFIEDIPQLILTTLVALEKRGGVWTPVAVFNVTTSAFNFTFNILDMLTPLEEVDVEGAKTE